MLRDGTTTLDCGNRAFCKEHGTRMSGPPLGRPPQEIPAATKKQSRADEALRNTVESRSRAPKRSVGRAEVRIEHRC